MNLGIDVIRIARRDGDIDTARLIADPGAAVGGAVGDIKAHPTIRIGRNRSEIGGTSARGQGPLVNPVSAILVEIRLHGCGKTTHADSGNDAGGGAVVDQGKTRDVLPHSCKIIGSARTSPVRAAVVGKIEPGLGARDDVVAVARINPHLADRLVLGELPSRKRQPGPENISAKKSPRIPSIGRLQNTLAAHRERTVVEIAGARVNGVVIVWVDRERIDADSA